MEVPLGAIVEVPAGRGIVRFVGPTLFAPGKWVGIELSEPNGKNDGSVAGTSYFTCRMPYGMFVRASQIRHIEIPAVASPPIVSMPPPPTPSARPTHKSSGSVSAGSPSVSRGASARSATTSTTPSSTRAPSPQKPTTAPTSRPTIGRLAPPTPLKRSPVPSILSPPATSQPRHFRTPSVSRTLPLQPGQPSLAKGSPLIRRTPDTIPQASFSEASPPLHNRPLQESPKPFKSSLISEPSELGLSTAATPSATLVSPSSPSSPARQLVDESQELRAKLRVLETKRADDDRHIKELETKLLEAATFVSLRPKLQAKLQSLQTENLSLKRQVADTQTQVSALENKMEEQSEQLEMAMLDKEVAEEKAEVAESELELEKEAKAQLEVELEVWKGGNATAGAGGESGGRTEMEFRQLEKHNERLKDALIRLREITQESEQEQRRKVTDLERELASVDDIQGQYTQTLARLEHADLQVEDLKQQLDDALGAEEMLMQLTERNLLMGEKIEEMRITIEDLEALQELNNELEEAHVETEKGLQEDLNQKDIEIREYVRKVEVLQEGLQDYEGTIQQFRELVNSLQSELDSLRHHTQARESESQAQATQAAAIMSLNMRLQSTATRNQAKNIDMELRKLDALQAREMLSIVQPYLPQVYVESDGDATNCYMFFQRMAFKTDLINSIVASQHGLPESLNGTVSEKLVGVCDMRGRIAHLSTLCKRFSTILRKCDVEIFIDGGRMYPEVAPLEKRLDMHIDLLRREDFREMECISDVSKMTARFEHLAESLFEDSELDLGERELDYALQVDHELDTFYAAVGNVKAIIEAATKDDEVIVEVGDLNLETSLVEPLQRVLDHSRPIRNASKKLLKRMEEVVNETSALKAHLVPQFSSLAMQISKLVEFAIPFAQVTGIYISDARAQKHSFDLSTILGKIRQVASTAFGSLSSPWDAVCDAVTATMQEMSALFALTQEKENMMKITGEAPWVARVDEIKQLAAVNLDAERTVTKLQEEILTLVRGVKTRDQTIQEGSVKIELMERRMETVKRQADTISDLENQLAEAHRDRAEFQGAMESVQSDLDGLEQENETLKKRIETMEGQQPAGGRATEDDAPVVESNYETSHLLEQNEALRNTVRFLRSENSFLKGQDLLREIQSLPDLVFDIPTPPLSPSGTDDSFPDQDSPTSLRTLATESTLLFREVIEYSSKPRVVDLTAVNSKKAWITQKQLPSHQLRMRKLEGEKLQKRVKSLVEKSASLRLTSLPKNRTKFIG